MPLRGRSGFTLVETIVALVLLQLGMLAMAATAGVAARDLADARAHRRAQVISQGGVHRLRPTACAALSSGSRTHAGGLVEHWRVETQGPVRIVSDSVSVPLSRGRRSAAVNRAWIACGR
jgi:Tfp pilus assembly protein PilV